MMPLTPEESERIMATYVVGVVALLGALFVAAFNSPTFYDFLIRTRDPFTMVTYWDWVTWFFFFHLLFLFLKVLAFDLQIDKIHSAAGVVLAIGYGFPILAITVNTISLVWRNFGIWSLVTAVALYFVWYWERGRKRKQGVRPPSPP